MRRLLTHGIAVLVLATVVDALLAPQLFGQAAKTTDQKAPAFEVASVKRNSSWWSRAFQMSAPPGRFTATNVPLRELIQYAYQIHPFQLEGGPAWISSERFDIVAKVAGNPPPPAPGAPGAAQLMMRTLLAERFKLALRHQAKEFPIYALVKARADGKLGPRLQKSTIDCAVASPTAATASGRPLCGLRGFQGGLQSGGLPIVHLASNLSQLLQRVVVDRTGLTGNFDFELTWTPDQLPQGPPPSGSSPIDPNGPLLSTALQEQLGLKLEPSRGPVDVLVIDRAEKPIVD